MKFSLHNLLTFYKTERMLFILIVLCVMSSTIVLHFAYGLYQNYHVIRVEKENEMQEMVVEIVDPTRVTKEALETCLLSLSDDVNHSVVDYIVHPVIEPLTSLGEENGWGYFDVRFTIKDHAIAPCGIFRENLEQYGTLYEGRYFTAEEEATGAAVAIIGDDAGSNRSCIDYITIRNDKNGHLIQLGDRVFQVIGVQKMTILPIIPFNSLEANTQLNHNIYICMDRSITRSQYEEIRDVLSNQFQNAIIIPELVITETEDVYFYNTILLISVAVSLLAAANFSIIYQYMLEKRRKVIAVFRICGCKKIQALGIFLGECLMIILPAYLISAVTYAKLLLPQLSPLFPYMAASYHPGIYAAIFVIYLFTTLMTLLLMMTGQIHRKSLLECKGRDGR